MKEKNLELVAENFFALFPLLQKKLMKPDHCKINPMLSHSHFQILFILNEFGVLPVSEIGKKLMISSPNMTPLIDKLIREELVERVPSREDRRIIPIKLTAQGKHFLEEQQKIMSTHLKERLSSLTNQDLQLLAVSLENIKTVFLKLNS